MGGGQLTETGILFTGPEKMGVGFAQLYPGREIVTGIVLPAGSVSLDN